VKAVVEQAIAEWRAEREVPRTGKIAVPVH